MKCRHLNNILVFVSYKVEKNSYVEAVPVSLCLVIGPKTVGYFQILYRRLSLKTVGEPSLLATLIHHKVHFAERPQINCCTYHKRFGEIQYQKSLNDVNIKCTKLY